MGLFNSLTNPLSWVSGDIAIDLGTANTLVYIKGKGVLINEPSIVSKSVHNDKIIEVVNEAKAMVLRTHREIETIRPLRDGVIADYKMADAMIRGFIRKLNIFSDVFTPSETKDSIGVSFTSINDTLSLL